MRSNGHNAPDAKPSGLSGLVGGAAGGIGGHIYASSVSKGGNFANNVIGSVATGSITQMGTMTGDKAVEALHSYMGHAALEPGAENIPTYQNVEIGGGRITGTEVTRSIQKASLLVCIMQTSMWRRKANTQPFTL